VSERWHEGERNATQLFREIQQLGYPGGELAVQRYLRQFRHGRGHAGAHGHDTTLGAERPAPAPVAGPRLVARGDRRHSGSARVQRTSVL
jgi:hypothetical protein